MLLLDSPKLEKTSHFQKLEWIRSPNVKTHSYCIINSNNKFYFNVTIFFSFQMRNSPNWA